MRNLEEDLKICNNASPGPWEWWDYFGRVNDGDTTWEKGNDNPPNELLRVLDIEFITADKLMEMSDDELLTETIIAGIDDDGKPDDNAGLFIRKKDAEFIAQARIGWPEAISRAMAAEKKLTEYQKGLK